MYPPLILMPIWMPPSMKNPTPPPSLPPAPEKAQFVQQGFNQIAQCYDRLNDCMTAGLHRGWKREAVRRLHCGPDAVILDLCTGTGDIAGYAAEQLHESGGVAALDFAMEMMKAGRSREHSSPKVQWVCGDALTLPFGASTFDGATVGFGLRNVTDLPCALREVWRVLKPGAWLVNLDTAASPWRILLPFYRFHMNQVVPRLGRWLAGSPEMYSYLAHSAAAFDAPRHLENRFAEAGFIATGHAYRPPGLGGAALVWGQKPHDEAGTQT